MTNAHLRLMTFCALLTAFGSARFSVSSEVSITLGTRIRFDEAAEAAAALRRTDAFLETLSPFDRAARKKTDQAVSQADFVEFIAKQTLSWNSGEIARISGILHSISNRIAGLRLPLPAAIGLIKTTGREEGDAAYCRGNNIVLPVRHVGSPDRSLERLLTHELFHILSRNNPKLRDSLYGIVGFKACNEIPYPAELAARKLTNPDAPKTEHYLTIQFQGQPTPAVPILFSSAERYDPQKGGEFFAYLTFKLLAIEQRNDHWTAVLDQAHPRLFDVADVEGFYDQVGRNTDYIIHPEELLADNFVLLVLGGEEIHTPEILHAMRRILSAR